MLEARRRIEWRHESTIKVRLSVSVVERKKQHSFRCRKTWQSSQVERRSWWRDTDESVSQVEWCSGVSSQVKSVGRSVRWVGSGGVTPPLEKWKRR